MNIASIIVGAMLGGLVMLLVMPLIMLKPKFVTPENFKIEKMSIGIENKQRDHVEFYRLQGNGFDCVVVVNARMDGLIATDIRCK